MLPGRTSDGTERSRVFSSSMCSVVRQSARDAQHVKTLFNVDVSNKGNHD
jgi:hypothetical protein